MDETIIELLMVALLVVPIAFIVLLIVYISKTNALTKRVQLHQSELDWFKAEVWRLNLEVSKLREAGVALSGHGASATESSTLGDAVPPPDREQAISPDSGMVQSTGAASKPTEPMEPAPETPGPVLPVDRGPLLAPIPPPETVPESAPIGLAPPPQSSPSLAPPSPFQSEAPDLRPQGSQAGTYDVALATSGPTSEPFSGQPGAPPRSKRELEALIGGRFLNWIGAIATIIGIGFFLGYAFQNNWIPPWMRVGIVFGIGAAFLAGGNYADKKNFKFFSQGLIGAGISILYLAAYASFNFYHLVPQKSAFVLMSGVTVIAFLQAFKFNSLAVSLLGWAGGFLTPFLLSTGVANEVGLFAYISILAAGLLAVVVIRSSWWVLEALTLGATYLIYVLWYNNFYAPGDVIVTAGFLTGFWLMFLALDVIQLLVPSKPPGEIREIVGGFSAIFYYSALYVIISPLRHDWMGLVTISLGAGYLVVSLVTRRARASHPVSANRFYLTAIILLVLATAIQYSGYIVVFYWSLEGVVLVFLGARWKTRVVAYAAVLLLAVALFRLLLVDVWALAVPADQFVLFYNHRALAFLSLAASLAAAAVLLGRAWSNARHTVGASLHYGWCLLLIIWLVLETSDEFHHLTVGATGDALTHLDFLRDLTIGVILAAVSLPLVWGGFKTRVMALVHSGLVEIGLAVLALGVAGLSYRPISEFTPVVNVRAAAIIFGLSALIAIAYWLNVHVKEHAWLRAVLGIVWFAWAGLLFTLCTVETHDAFRLAGKSAQAMGTAGLDFREYMTFAIVWAGLSLPLVWLGINKQIVPLGLSGTFTLVLAAGIAIEQGYGYAPINEFTLLANWRAVAFVCIVAAMLAVAAWIKDAPAESDWPGETYAVLRVVVALIIVFWLTVETKDYFGRELYLASVGPGAGSNAFPGLSGEYTRLANLRQLALSLVWLIYSIFLIVFGMWRRALSLRIVAIVVFGITILKIFVYDLSFLQSLYRIFSFIGLGLILLTVSFLYQRYRAVIFDTGTPAGLEPDQALDR
ncbi:MAG TPA: DUF2339 domain-containing protein [Blastocatellia bacterium]|nr:DUF2339 domain-containing protein [Blastocatellia bacterium]